MAPADASTATVARALVEQDDRATDRAVVAAEDLKDFRKTCLEVARGQQSLAHLEQRGKLADFGRVLLRPVAGVWIRTRDAWHLHWRRLSHGRW
jgi:hypothetical protein